MLKRVKIVYHWGEERSQEEWSLGDFDVPIAQELKIFVKP